MKPSIQPFLKNRDNKTPYDCCKPEIRPYFDKFLTKKKTLNDPRKAYNILVNSTYMVIFFFKNHNIVITFIKKI